MHDAFCVWFPDAFPWRPRRQDFRPPAAVVDAHHRSAKRQKKRRSDMLAGLNARISRVTPTDEEEDPEENDTENDSLISGEAYLSSADR